MSSAREVLARLGLKVSAASASHVRITEYSGDQLGASRLCSWAALREAAEQPDADAAAVYQAIRRVAQRALKLVDSGLEEARYVP